MAFDATLSGEESNSLVEIAEATEIAGDLPQTDGVISWVALGDDDKGRTLVASTLTFQGLRWKGKPCKAEQSLCFPRLIETAGVNAVCSKTPYEIKVACTYLAIFIGSSGGYLAVADEGGKLKTEGENPFPGLSPQDLEGYSEIDLGRGAVKLKLQQDKEIRAIDYIPPFSLNLISRYLIHSNSINVADFSRSPGYGAAPAFGSASHTRVVEIDGKLWPETGGWASNPL